MSVRRTCESRRWLNGISILTEFDSFNVVKAYSLYDEEVGYTQGLQFIVGPLLLNVRPLSLLDVPSLTLPLHRCPTKKPSASSSAS